MKQRLMERLAAAGQQHLLRDWDRLDEPARQRLAAQIEAIDLQQLAGLIEPQAGQPDWAELARRAEPPAAVRLQQQTSSGAGRESRLLGEQALADSQVAMILVAGGQGSRLGFNHPKGLLPLGPVSGRCLFQILLENLAGVERRYGGRIPLYLMTSPATHDETVAAFEERGWFGLRPDQVRFFCQGTLPAVDAATGQLLLDEPGRLAVSPDGHGGMLAAIAASGSLADARQRGVRWLFYGQVDNPLLQVCSAELIGWHRLRRSEMTTQVVAKVDPLERVGNLVSIDGRAQIIEYSDLPEAVARSTDQRGRLRLWAGSIAVHVWDLDFLERMASASDSLPLHLALKRVPYIDKQGRRVEPDRPNAIKFERFIFDLLPRAERALAVEAERSEAFAPVKNADHEASDTPSTAQRAMVALHRKWLQQAGARVPEDVAVEISGSWALDADEVRARMATGTYIRQPSYFGPDPSSPARP